MAALVERALVAHVERINEARSSVDPTCVRACSHVQGLESELRGTCPGEEPRQVRWSNSIEE